MGGKRLRVQLKSVDARTPVHHAPLKLKAARGPISNPPTTNSRALTTMVAQKRVTMPVELLVHVFDALEQTLEDPCGHWWKTAATSNKVWVKLSMISKEWYEVTKKYRSTLVLGSEKSAKLFLNRIRQARIVFTKLQYTVALPEELLAKLYRFISGNLTAVSVPLDMLQTRHMRDLVSTGVNSIKCIEVHGKPWDKYTGTFWKKAYILHDIPTLTELALSNIYIAGRFEPFQASVRSPIKRLILDKLAFDVGAPEHLCWPLCYSVTDLWLSLKHDMGAIIDIFGHQAHRSLTRLYMRDSCGGWLYLSLPAGSEAYAPHQAPAGIAIDIDKQKVTCNGRLLDSSATDQALLLVRAARSYHAQGTPYILEGLFKVCQITLSDTSWRRELRNSVNLRKDLSLLEEEEVRQAQSILRGGPVGIRPTSELAEYAAYQIKVLEED